ncbi:MAG: hypothetical protein V7K67_09630 [Nostoc sp.]|uniref:hypothetical protein n=1 Tax=Nostoc sp. TaxID=1180 RepID=UPI002FF353B1
MEFFNDNIAIALHTLQDQAIALCNTIHRKSKFSATPFLEYRAIARIQVEASAGALSISHASPAFSLLLYPVV